MGDTLRSVPTARQDVPKQLITEVPLPWRCCLLSLEEMQPCRQPLASPSASTLL